MTGTPDNADLLARIDQIDQKTDVQSQKIGALYDALMVPHPGQSASLLNRMAAVTIAVEGGQGVGRIVIWIAGILAAIGAVWAFLHPGAGQ
jgi:hypothetical protein